jgi:hypothetical protein
VEGKPQEAPLPQGRSGAGGGREATGLLPPDGRALLALLDLRANGLDSVPVSTTAAYRWLARRAR